MLTPIEQQTYATEALLRMIEHRTLVRQQMRRLAHALLEAADVHDLSKFAPAEFLGFANLGRAVRDMEFGSPEYEMAMKMYADTIALHHADNPHHPECHPYGGIKVMNLVEIIEMVADWGAAAATYRNASFGKGVKIQTKRHNLDPQHLYLVWLIRDALVGTESADLEFME